MSEPFDKAQGEPVIVRGQALPDMSVEQLRALHDQLIAELEAVETELDLRR
jgi:hypothetical protein